MLILLRMVKRMVFLIFGVVFLMNLGSATFVPHIIFNIDNSLPQRVFLGWKRYDFPQKEEIFAFEHPFYKTNMIKQVVGLPGDLIENVEGEIFVNGRSYGKVMEISKSGKSYHAVASCIIPEGYVYLYASHPESFDSRYQEFGLIKIVELKRVVKPLI